MRFKGSKITMRIADAIATLPAHHFLFRTARTSKQTKAFSKPQNFKTRTTLNFPHFSRKTLTHINIHTTYYRTKIYSRKHDKLHCDADK